LATSIRPGRRVSTPWDHPVRYSAEGVELVCVEVGEEGRMPREEGPNTERRGAEGDVARFEGVK
jgi:hypothetical protein